MRENLAYLLFLAITDLAFLIALFAPALVNLNWVFLKTDTEKHRETGNNLRVPEANEFRDDSWLFAFQDHAVQLNTLFVTWVVLLYHVITFTLDIFWTQTIQEFVRFIRSLNGSMFLFSVIIGLFLFFVIIIGLISLFRGAFSRIEVVAKYKQSRPPLFLIYHPPPFTSTITIGRIIVGSVSALFRVWREVILLIEKVGI